MPTRPRHPRAYPANGGAQRGQMIADREYGARYTVLRERPRVRLVAVSRYEGLVLALGITSCASLDQ